MDNPLELAKRNRNHGYHKSRPIRFGNGETWDVPLPCWWVNPIFKNGRTTGKILHRFGFQDRDVDTYVALLADTTDPEQSITLAATIAGSLVSQLYNVSDDDLDRILVIDPSKPESLDWIREVVAIATWHHLPEGSEA